NPIGKKDEFLRQARTTRFTVNTQELIAQKPLTQLSSVNMFQENQPTINIVVRATPPYSATCHENTVYVTCAQKPEVFVNGQQMRYESSLPAEDQVLL
ncbi:hypothetical protein GCK32_020609, partial [Trichostrongylus colubriformis]